MFVSASSLSGIIKDAQYYTREASATAVRALKLLDHIAQGYRRSLTCGFVGAFIAVVTALFAARFLPSPTPSPFVNTELLFCLLASSFILLMVGIGGYAIGKNLYFLRDQDHADWLQKELQELFAPLEVPNHAAHQDCMVALKFINTHARQRYAYLPKDIRKKHSASV